MNKDTIVVITQNLDRRQMRKNQYILAVVVSILSFAQGNFMGWISPVLPLLQSKDTPAAFPPIGDEEASWISSVSSLASVLYIPLISYVADKLGRKWAGYLVAAPFVTCWVLVLCADSVVIMYAARCLGGLSAGGAGILVPTFINDVAEDGIRGLLGTFFGLTVNLGTLYSYVAGSYVSYLWFNISCLVVPVAFLVGFFWIPESPLFLLTKGKEQEAKSTLAWLRDGRCTDEEFLRMKMRAEDFVKNKQNKVTLSDITDRGTFRALLICLGIMANASLSGSGSIMAYSVTIFQDSGSTLSPNVSTIIIGAIMVFGGFFSTVVIEKSGRRLLLIAGNITISVCLFLLGLFFYLKNSGSDVHFIQWIPITSLSGFVFCFGCTLGPITFILTTELPSAKARGMVQSVSIIFVSVAMFLITKTFTILSHLMGAYGCFWLYGSVCVLSSVVIYLTVPETKNRSSEDIVSQLNSEQYIMSVISRKHIHTVKSMK
ncbi:facilitated trehalose transporter Tret1-like [Bacillus rossius redtenbacheri]|uniref:facilitated trehalose transporter Tret1-like n=1 Tax=Bacillus rossius redtenbacheri TaxID=93214 RepID=UPI002FDD30A7